MNDARNVILARRARFVALALASVGCHEEAGTKAPDTVVLPPTPEAGPPDAGAVAVVEDAGPPVQDAGAPDAISDATAVRYAKARSQIDALRASIAEARMKVAQQGAYTSANATQWRALVAEVQSLYEAVGYFAIYCPKRTPETEAFLAWVGGEQTKLRTSVDDVKQDAEKKLQDKTTTGAARWDQLLSQWNQANPRPCLSIACDNW